MLSSISDLFFESQYCLHTFFRFIRILQPTNFPLSSFPFPPLPWSFQTSLRDTQKADFFAVFVRTSGGWETRLENTAGLKMFVFSASFKKTGWGQPQVLSWWGSLNSSNITSIYKLSYWLSMVYMKWNNSVSLSPKLVAFCKRFSPYQLPPKQTNTQLKLWQ